jgi:chromosome segregation ATPase
MNEAVSNMAGAIKQMAVTAGGEAREAINVAARTAAEAVNSMAGTLGAPVHDMAGALDRATQQMSHIEETLAAHRTAFTGATTSAGEIQTAMSAAARSVREASAPLTTATQIVAKSSDQIAAAVETAVVSIKASEEGARALAEKTSSLLTQATKAWADYESRFAAVDRSLEQAFNKIIGHVQTSIEVMHKYIMEVDGKLAETVDRLNGGIEELSEFSQHIQNATADLKNAIERVSVS